ncbi:cell division protein ZapB [Vibrio algarum]|uniref:Cell division protein ZapB n=1 Tax=Vibrio algarum TaxID=3020714 RepID=A0ABT4YMI5_9VIBR|nr:cell division protein ZapB [Vibrio sp. KJ40-1]MDB1122764.1 cell division protein ZapB [Vibrio sp. KJ40-1]
MSLEVLEQLEAKIQTAVDTITLLQMELEEVKQKNQNLEQATTSLKDNCSDLEQQNEQMRQEHEAWQQRIRILLGKMEDVE